VNVNELIAKLETLTPEQKELPVYSEGCDCSKPADGVMVWYDNERSQSLGLIAHVEITREDG
jgi:hypothetical protein